jgi:uncharacterized protein YndB with AHSA1/START domain
MKAMAELELTVKRTISASRERVFNAWLSAETLAKFMQTPAPDNGPTRVSNDPVKGGRFTIIMVTPDKEIAHSGTYLEIVPHSRLSFTWESPYSLDDSVVTIDFAEPAPGTTDITLRHVKFRSEDARRGHEHGWSAILGNLAATFA